MTQEQWEEGPYLPGMRTGYQASSGKGMQRTGPQSKERTRKAFRPMESVTGGPLGRPGQRMDSSISNWRVNGYLVYPSLLHIPNKMQYGKPTCKGKIMRFPNLV